MVDFHAIARDAFHLAAVRDAERKSRRLLRKWEEMPDKPFVRAAYLRAIDIELDAMEAAVASGAAGWNADGRLTFHHSGECA